MENGLTIHGPEIQRNHCVLRLSSVRVTTFFPLSFLYDSVVAGKKSVVNNQTQKKGYDYSPNRRLKLMDALFMI
jgi:hypothetical protein